MWPDWNADLFRIAAASSLRVIILASIVAIVLAALRVRSAGVRHAAWTAVLAAMLLMPILPRIIPAIPIPLNVPGATDAMSWEQPDEFRLRSPDGAVGAPLGLVQPPARGDASQSSAILPNKESAGGSLSPGADTRPTAGALWALLALGIYVAGLLFFLLRLLVGWVAMRRLVRGCTTCDGPSAGFSTGPVVVSESQHVAAPLTTGVFSRRIILPATWRTWSEEKLRAVLAHELEHVRRRDPLVALVAYINRAVFWFHPLAWWLERTLATCAEDACDGAAVRGGGAEEARGDHGHRRPHGCGGGAVECLAQRRTAGSCRTEDVVDVVSGPCGST